MQTKTFIEGGSGRYEFDLYEPDPAVPGGFRLVSIVTAISITLVDLNTATAIRDNQNALNANNCTFAAGHFVWTIQPADTTMVTGITAGESPVAEIHLALITFEWGGGQSELTVQAQLICRPAGAL